MDSLNRPNLYEVILLKFEINNAARANQNNAFKAKGNANPNDGTASPTDIDS
jgi:hypothetical protein